MVTVNLRAQEYKPSPISRRFTCRSMRFSISMCATGSSTIGPPGRSRPLEPLHRIAECPPIAAGYSEWPSDQKKAFWLNAYNALVLQTVVNNYPISGACVVVSGEQRPPDSRRVREDAAHDRRQERHARSDRDERAAGFGDPRVYLALGRGAVGSGRLRSEAFSAKAVDRQLDEARKQFVTRRDRPSGCG